MEQNKYSDQFVDWLVEEGYTHCFFLAGGNIMHLLDSVRTRMTCIPFVNEIGAAIAAEYFTATAEPEMGKAFVLVTAGPGLTNVITAIGSAYMESRELLVVGGQVKSADLRNEKIRQRGIQEIDGVSLVKSICKTAIQMTSPMRRSEVLEVVRLGAMPRKGPVFIEMCLDAQGAAPMPEEVAPKYEFKRIEPTIENIQDFQGLVLGAERPVILLGGGLDRKTAHSYSSKLEKIGIPVMTTWNGADLISSDSPIYFGRPNTWGQRYSNVLIQQADLIIALGTRLGMQQSGFAWEEFGQSGKIIHVDIDKSELEKGHPITDLQLPVDANAMLEILCEIDFTTKDFSPWRTFAENVKLALPVSEDSNKTEPGYVSPYSMLGQLGDFASENDVIIPCSSGGAFTVSYQSLFQRGQQKMLSDKGMASMGYGLSGAIGASLANPRVTTYLIEGDGGFAQNMQELGTVSANNLPLKILLFVNNGYASIRMTQRNYFGGSWIGCDAETGVGFPNWSRLAEAFGIPYARMSSPDYFGGEVEALLKSDGPCLIEVPIDPEQTYYPKIASSVQLDGSMKSDPIHLMQPPLDAVTAEKVFKFLK